MSRLQFFNKDTQDIGLHMSVDDFIIKCLCHTVYDHTMYSINLLPLYCFEHNIGSFHYKVFPIAE